MVQVDPFQTEAPSPSLESIPTPMQNTSDVQLTPRIPTAPFAFAPTVRQDFPFQRNDEPSAPSTAMHIRLDAHDTDADSYAPLADGMRAVFQVDPFHQLENNRLLESVP